MSKTIKWYLNRVRELLGLRPVDRPLSEQTVTAVLARWQDFIRATLDYLQSLR